MKIDLSQFRETFLLESADHIATMEAGLLQLRSTPGDMELLNSIFRSAHSIKGGAGVFELTSLVRFTHSLENLLDRMRSAEIQATDEVIGLLLRAVDVLNLLLGDGAQLPPEALELERRFAELAPCDAEDASVAGKESPPDGQRELRLYKVDFRPGREFFNCGNNPVMLLRNLAAIGTVSCCQLHAEELPALADLDPAQCYLSWTVELASGSSAEDLREVFEFVEHLAEIQIQSAGAQPAREAQAAPAAAPRVKQELAKEAEKKASSGGDSSSVRVAIDKVDRLIDLVGELVVANVMTAQMIKDFEPSCLPQLREAVAGMERSTRELHERVMSVRLLPVGSLFQRYKRTVYDIAQATGKQIRLETEGEDTEIDKSMLELLGDPLTHLVRNSADHGIESPDLRRAAGKPAEGVIRLKAFHRSGRIVIEGSDDGKGIDLEKVRNKAIERGLIGAEAMLSEEQVRMLIFEPGFSTQEAVSDLSGRGVGMDVVKRNIEKMSGSVSVASEKGRGTTVTIELPLTLAVVEGLLVRVVDRTLVLPLLSVVETVPLPEDQIVRVAEQGEVVIIRGESIPLLRMNRFLGLPPQGAEAGAVNGNASLRRLAVIVQSGQKKIGLVVDELLGQQQVVGKSLKRNFRQVEGIMGATILGDGCVAPIIDVAGIGAMNLYSLQLPGKVLPRGGASPWPVAAA